MQQGRAALRYLGSLAVLVWCSWRRRIRSDDHRSLVSQARRIVDSSLRDNVARRSVAPRGVNHVVLWGGKFPLRFSLALGFIIAALTAVLLPAPFDQVALFDRKIPDAYSHTDYVGAVWAVQATLVALVYPFVLTFVTIMLQRRAASKLALSAYLLDSAVLPAGASSLLLLTALSIQYFLAVATPKCLFLWLAALNGVWFLANVGLTGQFLFKTIRYVEDDVGQAAYRNMAVSIVLREELVTSLSQHLLLSAAERLKWRAQDDENAPRISFSGMSHGTIQASLQLRRKRTLNDVHLGMLEWVARRWSDRVASVPASKASGQRKATLHLYSLLHGSAIGHLELCSVVDGPELTDFESVVVRQAFLFGAQPRRFLSGNTADMLEELAVEVKSLSEQKLHTAAKQALRRLIDLHVALLEACHEKTEDEGDVSSAASLMTSPFGWGGRNLNSAWIEPYRPLAQFSAGHLDEDQTVLAFLAYGASNITAASELQLPTLIAELFLLQRLLDHSLATWWSREIQRLGVAPSPDGQRLTAPAEDDYRNAVVTVISGLESFRFPFVERQPKPSVAWKERCRAALAWAAHVDVAASLLLNAAGRGDIVAAEWYCDNFVAWWANHEFEFDPQSHIEYEPGLNEVRLGITNLDWSAAEQRLRELAKRELLKGEALAAVYNALRHYWESMRLVVCLLLVQQANSGRFPKLAAKVIANILKTRLFSAGPRAHGTRLDEADEVVALYFDTCLTDQWVTNRLDSFCERRHRFNEGAPVVSGWIYTGGGAATDLASKTNAIIQLMLALRPGPRQPWRVMHELLQQVRVGLPELKEIEALATACINATKGKALRPSIWASELITAALEVPAPAIPDRRHLFHGLLRLREGVRTRIDAHHAALDVRQEAVDKLAKRIATVMQDNTALVNPNKFCNVQVGHSSHPHHLYATGWKFAREGLSDPPVTPISDGQVASLGQQFLNQTVRYTLQRLLEDRAPTAIPHGDDATLLLGIESAAQKIRSQGLSPVAIVPPGGPAAKAVRPYSWSRPGLPPLPTGVELSFINSDRSDFAVGFVNDTPIINQATPHGATYVVPLEWMARLVLELEASDRVVSANFTVTGKNEVAVDFSWSASLQPK